MVMNPMVESVKHHPKKTNPSYRTDLGFASSMLGKSSNKISQMVLACPWKLVSKLVYNLLKGLITYLYTRYNPVTKYHRHPSRVRKIYHQLNKWLEETLPAQSEKNSPRKIYSKQMIGNIGQKNALIYPLVNQHSNGISPCSIRNTSFKGPFSIAMLVYQSVFVFLGGSDFLTDFQLQTPAAGSGHSYDHWWLMVVEGRHLWRKSGQGQMRRMYGISTYMNGLNGWFLCE